VAHTAEGKKEFHCKALVLACGGFEADPEMRARYLGRAGTWLRSAAPVSTPAMAFAWHWKRSDALRSLERLSRLGHRFGVPRRGSGRHGSQRYSYPYCVMVNREGDRFVDEGEDLQVYTYAKTGRRILEQPGSIAYQIFDKKTQPLLRSAYQNARPLVAQSIEELADGLAIESEKLKRNSRRSMAPFKAANLILRARRESHRGITPPKSNWASPLILALLRLWSKLRITFTMGLPDRRARPGPHRRRSIHPGLWAAES